MRLIVHKKRVIKGFPLQLQKNLKNQIYINMDVKNDIHRWNEYLNMEEVNKVIFIKPHKVKVTNIIHQITNHLLIKQIDDGFLIYIDDINKFPNSKLTFSDMANLINYGNLEIEGFSVFSKSFNYIRDNIEKYYRRYKLFLM